MITTVCPSPIGEAIIQNPERRIFSGIRRPEGGDFSSSATPRCYIYFSRGRTTPGLGVSSFRYRILREGYSVESVGPRVVISLQVQHRGVTFLEDVQLLV
ncbi:hypothetical protein QL285_088031 [Trifolium repens]|nr:hypothetical protein QL285_088031 [Trifolium repens]